MGYTPKFVMGRYEAVLHCENPACDKRAAFVFDTPYVSTFHNEVYRAGWGCIIPDTPWPGGHWAEGKIPFLCPECCKKPMEELRGRKDSGR